MRFCGMISHGKQEEHSHKQPEMVTISREEYEELKLQNQWLLEQLGLAKKRQFGKSSERLQEGLMDSWFSWPMRRKPMPMGPRMPQRSR